jgi:hypothetical protein
MIFAHKVNDPGLHVHVRLFGNLNHGPLNKVAKDRPCLNTKVFSFKFIFGY